MSNDNPTEHLIDELEQTGRFFFNLILETVLMSFGLARIAANYKYTITEVSMRYIQFVHNGSSLEPTTQLCDAVA